MLLTSFSADLNICLATPVIFRFLCNVEAGPCKNINCQSGSNLL